MIHLALRPDPPAVALDDALDDRKPHPRSVELLRTVQPLEYAEQFVGVPPVESGAVVLHEVHRLIAVRL